MDDRTRALLDSLPTCPERKDEVANQVVELIDIARKLGMSRVADYLFAELTNYRRYHGPKALHPEQRPGEVHLLNSAPETVRYIGWKTKRAGVEALDVDGIVIPGQVPVFISAAEFERAGQLTDRDTVAPGEFVPAPVADTEPLGMAGLGGVRSRKKTPRAPREVPAKESGSLDPGVLPGGFFGTSHKAAE